jgi:hypothetical protein
MQDQLGRKFYGKIEIQANRDIMKESGRVRACTHHLMLADMISAMPIHSKRGEGGGRGTGALIDKKS